MVVMFKHQWCRVATVLNPFLAVAASKLERGPSAPLRAVMAAILIVYCCYVLARIFWFVMPLPQLETSGPELGLISSSSPLISAQADIDIEALKELHLFGEPGDNNSQMAVALPQIIEAEETRLDLLLLGVVVSDVAASARAIISHRNQQDLFASGDALPGGSQVKLEQVLPGRVIINNAGRYESLWLYEEQQDVNVSVAAPAPTGNRTARVQLPPVPAKKESAPVVEQKVVAAVQVPADAETLADIVQFTPVHAEGRVLGYRVAPGRAAGLFKAYGLQPNDVVTAVNGMSLDDPTRALKIYRQLQGAKRASFELVRNGEARIIDIALDEQRGRG